MKDRAMQALYLLALDPIAECLADPNSYGFRQERCQADAIGQSFLILAPPNRAKWVYEDDSAACCDRISHAWLLKNIPMNKTILRQWLTAGFIDQTTFSPTDEGIPRYHLTGHCQSRFRWVGNRAPPTLSSRQS